MVRRGAGTCPRSLNNVEQCPERAGLGPGTGPIGSQEPSFVFIWGLSWAGRPGCQSSPSLPSPPQSSPSHEEQVSPAGLWESRKGEAGLTSELCPFRRPARVMVLAAETHFWKNNNVHRI